MRDCKVVLWPGGLRMTRRAADTVALTWDEIESAEWNRVDGETLLNLTNGDQQTFVGADFFGSHRRTRQFIETVNRWKRESEGVRGT